jgi:magnesium-transporting ATPase (P-type)
MQLREIPVHCIYRKMLIQLLLLCFRRVVYGSNEIIVPIYGIITLLFLEVLNPFYVFQLFSFCLWFADDYMYYALAILAMSVFGIVMAILQTRKVSEFMTAVPIFVHVLV